MPVVSYQNKLLGIVCQRYETAWLSNLGVGDEGGDSGDGIHNAAASITFLIALGFGSVGPQPLRGSEASTLP